ncbi:uncharacterized protein LOC135096268 isoform X1 [Scylla paramamosain]|uniref:uncharacterized protein LOC135096268 isoform X1 n=2 Tax=Scylla paramamosain TaxID=85552 RepID=UPI0030827330
MKVAVVVVVVMVVVVVVVEGARQDRKKGRSNKADKKEVSVPKEFSEWDKFNKLFLHHISKKPSKLKEEDIKPHLYTLLKTLEFLTVVDKYLDENLASVRSEEEARRVFTLLDLFSAQEPHRLRYLKQMRDALTALFMTDPEAAKHTIPSHFILDAFDRHIQARQRRTQAVLRRVMVGNPDNLNTLVHYRPGRYLALDSVLRLHNIPSPFLEVNETQWYHIKQASSPHLTLSIDLLTWRMILVNHTFSPTVFRFERETKSSLQERYEYVLRSAVLSPSAFLSFPCHQHRLCFSYKDPVTVEVVTLQRGEVAFIGKQTDGVFFLRDATGSKNSAFPSVSVPSVTPWYPGKDAHWILTPLKS